MRFSALGDVGDVIGVSSSILLLLLKLFGLLGGSLSLDGGRPSSLPTLRMKLSFCSILPEMLRLWPLAGQEGADVVDESHGSFIASVAVSWSVYSSWSCRETPETVLRRCEVSWRSSLPPPDVAVPSSMTGVQQAHGWTRLLSDSRSGSCLLHRNVRWRLQIADELSIRHIFALQREKPGAKLLDLRLVTAVGGERQRAQ